MAETHVDSTLLSGFRLWTTETPKIIYNHSVYVLERNLSVEVKIINRYIVITYYILLLCLFCFVSKCNKILKYMH
jgi:hypothetical protein